jgi:CheY-like chemotaxis protein
VRLPLSANLRPPEANGAPHAALPVARSDLRILIVEDADDFRDILQEILEDLGHEVSVAKNGIEGAARILELRPDVTLVDLGLPGIDGYELARRVRAAPNGGDLYLVALTGYGATGDRAKAQSAGFDRHLTKPISSDDLLEIVSSPKPARVT